MKLVKLCGLESYSGFIPKKIFQNLCMLQSSEKTSQQYKPVSI